MIRTTTLRYGEQNVDFRKSPTQVALKPAIRRARTMQFSLEALAHRVPTEHRGSLGSFEILDILAPEAQVASECTRLVQSRTVERIAPVYHLSDDEVPFVPEGTLLLSFHEDVPDSLIEDLLRRYDLGLTSHYEESFTALSSDPNTVELAERLQQESIVALAEPDLATPGRLLGYLPDDDLLVQQWHLENKGVIDGNSVGLKQDADARVVGAWKKLGNLGSQDVIVAVIDDGFDLSHPDLCDKVIYPWDFIRGNENVSPEADLFSEEAGDWHGTACAGVAVGRAGGGKIVGAAPNAKFMPVRMTEQLSPLGVEKWFKYVTKKGAWVVSCSWKADAQVYPLPHRIARALHHCATNGRDGKGSVIVFAAGNCGEEINDPPRSQNGFAIHPDVLAVAASTSLDRRASYSAKGRELAVCAPSAGRGGLAITTADVTGTYVDINGVERSRGYEAGEYYSQFGGTSSSCPLVAGICSLVLSANPNLTASDVRNIICATARKIGRQSEYQNGHSPSFGYGCVDAEAAVRKALADDCP